MNRDQYRIEDFLKDASFLNWVAKSDRQAMTDWDNWIKKDPPNKVLAEEAASIAKGIHFRKKVVSAETVAGAWEGVLARIKEEEARPVRRMHPVYYAAAAIFIGVLIAIGAYYWVNRDAQVEMFTQAGEMKTFILPDSSSITLRANSRLSYNQNWYSGETRNVNLSGEAYFEVKHGSPNEKFTVNTNELTLEVLGTKFTVSSRRGKTITVLNTGKIKLTGNAGYPEIVMAPGDYSELQKNGREFLVKTVNPDNYSAWTQRRFVFQDMSLEEIGRMIEDLYSVHVRIKDQDLGKRKLSGELKGENLNDLVKGICLSLNINATEKENTITFENK